MDWTALVRHFVEQYRSAEQACEAVWEEFSASWPAGAFQRLVDFALVGSELQLLGGPENLFPRVAILGAIGRLGCRQTSKVTDSVRIFDPVDQILASHGLPTGLTPYIRARENWRALAGRIKGRSRNLSIALSKIPLEIRGSISLPGEKSIIPRKVGSVGKSTFDSNRELHRAKVTWALATDPSLTRAQMDLIMPSSTAWLRRNDSDWYDVTCIYCRPPRPQDRESLRIFCRQELLDTLAQQPNISRAELRRKHQASFNWASKHDAVWLSNRCPFKHVRGDTTQLETSLVERNRRLVREFMAVHPGSNRTRLERAMKSVVRWLKDADAAWLDAVCPIKVRNLPRGATFEETRTFYRKILISETNCCPKLSRNQVVRGVPRPIKWLKANDGLWLDAHLPTSQQGPSRKKR